MGYFGTGSYEETLDLGQVLAGIFPEGLGLPFNRDLEVTGKHPDSLRFLFKDRGYIDFNEYFVTVSRSKFGSRSNTVFPEIWFFARQTAIGLFDDSVGSLVIGMVFECTGDVYAGRIELLYRRRDYSGGLLDFLSEFTVSKIDVTNVLRIGTEMRN